MPEQVVTTEELVRFAECRLAWWYDRTHSLARANGEELARRIALLGAVYGAGARDLPEYQLLTHLRERAERQAPPPASVVAPAPVRPADRPQRLLIGGILLGAVIMGCVLASLIFSLTQP